MGTLSRVFGNKAGYAIEISYDVSSSDPWLFGLFSYWVKDNRLGNADYFNLTDVFVSMKWTDFDCGKRMGGGLCELTHLQMLHWVSANIREENEISFDFDTKNLPADVARFSLLFHPCNGNDWLILVECAAKGILIYSPQNKADLEVLEQPISILEDTIKQAYLFLDSLVESQQN